MVNTEYRELLDQIFALLDTACQASLELLGRYTSGDQAASEQLLEDLAAVVKAVMTAREPMAAQLEHSCTLEMLENIEDTLEDIRRSMQAGSMERAAMKIEFQLFPFLRQLKEAVYFWGSIYPDTASMEEYYRNEFAEHYRNLYVEEGQAPRYRASVVVVAYDHLEMTKKCVESILKYTDFEKLNAELILVDHGSSEEVLKYFEELDVGKVIHYKVNMRGTMFCALPQICDSEYYVHVANDTVVTKDWLDVLLACGDSDPKIAAVSPATCNISNLQAIHVPVTDCDALVQFAETHNRSDPSLWNDRARILPAIGAFKINALNQIGFWDPLFYTFDFMDDDFSLRARRNGFRQILCEDVICYHRGSATVRDVQHTEDTLGEGRKLFLKKYGVDAWGTGFCYDYQLLQKLHILPGAEKPVNILGIDCGFGDTVLELRNRLRQKVRDVRIYHLTTESAYLPDLRPHSEDTVLTSKGQIISTLAGQFPDISFSYICMGSDLASFPDPEEFLKAAAARMVSNGQIVFFFQNPYFAVRLHQMLQFSLPQSLVHMLSPEHVAQWVKDHFSHAELTGVSQQIQGLNDFVLRHYGKEALGAEITTRLEIERYYVRCVH